MCFPVYVTLLLVESWAILTFIFVWPTLQYLINQISQCQEMLTFSNQRKILCIKIHLLRAKCSSKNTHWWRVRCLPQSLARECSRPLLLPVLQLLPELSLPAAASACGTDASQTPGRGQDKRSETDDKIWNLTNTEYLYHEVKVNLTRFVSGCIHGQKSFE